MMSVTTSMSAKRTPLYAQMDDVSTLRVVISANAIRDSHNPPTRNHVLVGCHRFSIVFFFKNPYSLVMLCVYLCFNHVTAISL